MRELCFGTWSFGELLAAAPVISVLAQRLKQLQHDGVVYIDAKRKGRVHFYRSTPAGEAFQPMVELMSKWGQRWAQGLIGPDDLDPKMLLWGMRRQTCPAETAQRCGSIRGYLGVGLVIDNGSAKIDFSSGNLEIRCPLVAIAISS